MLPDHTCKEKIQLMEVAQLTQWMECFQKSDPSGREPRGSIRGRWGDQTQKINKNKNHVNNRPKTSVSKCVWGNSDTLFFNVTYYIVFMYIILYYAIAILSLLLLLLLLFLLYYLIWPNTSNMRSEDLRHVTLQILWEQLETMTDYRGGPALTSPILLNHCELLYARFLFCSEENQLSLQKLSQLSFHTQIVRRCVCSETVSRPEWSPTVGNRTFLE